jgi:hypothetical protein
VLAPLLMGSVRGYDVHDLDDKRHGRKLNGTHV